MIPETPNARIKRMKMRSWRRGTKEMDMILGPYADQHLSSMDEIQLTVFDQLLEENDQDLYQWVTGQSSPPAPLAKLLDHVARHANTR